MEVCIQTNTQPFVIPDKLACQEPVILFGPVVAIQITPTENGQPSLGVLSRLPAGTMLHICGDGFDERTAKVCVNGHYYFVFRDEIDQRHVPMGRAN
jgi:hypothetical protein